MKKKYINKALICSLLAFPFVLSETQAFTDTDNHQYRSAIEYLHAESLVSGYPDGTFGPNKAINRAEFIKILINARFKSQITDGHKNLCFSDIKDKNAWFVPYACLAKEKGIVSGYSNGDLRPAQDINFVEASKILASIYSPTQLPADSNTWYKPYVSYLLDNNIVPAADIKSPNQKVTRGQMVEMIYRLSLKNNGLLNDYLIKRKTDYGAEFYPAYNDFIERNEDISYQIPFELTKPHNLLNSVVVVEKEKPEMTKKEIERELTKEYTEVINLEHPGEKIEGGFIKNYEEYISAAYAPSPENDISESEDIDIRKENLLKLINQERINKDKQSITSSQALNQSAQNFATHLVNNAFYGHMDKFGRKPYQRAKHFGYNGAVTEIITWGSEGEESSVEWWLNSEIHRNALMNREFNNIGIGIAQEPFNKKFVFIVVLGTQTQ